MACRSMMVGRVLTVAWRHPEHEDLVAVVGELRREHERQKRPLLYLSVIGPAALPQGGVRDELVKFYADILSYCDSMHIVIEGNEFQSSIKRSVIANVLLVLHGARGRVFIENTLEGVRAISPQEIRLELSEAARVAGNLYDFARDFT